jgi:hypothetical protein
MDVRTKGFVLSVAFLIGGCSQSFLEAYVDTTDWTPTISVSLAIATLDTPDPAPDNIPEPNPDPEKCPCKGTGILTHGDGHTTPCPYHGEDNKPDDPDASHKCKCDTKKTYCNCKAAYGKCNCDPGAMNISTTSVSKWTLFWARLFGFR